MTRWRKKRIVEGLVEKAWWEGFWESANGGRQRTSLRSYDPPWCDEVAQLARAAGFDASEKLREDAAARRRSDGGFTMGRRPKIAPRVYADAYAAARIAPRHGRHQDG